MGQLIGPALTLHGFFNTSVAVCIARDVTIPICWIKYSVTDFATVDANGLPSSPLLVSTISSLTDQVSSIAGSSGAESTSLYLQLSRTSGSVSNDELLTSVADDFYLGWSVKVFNVSSSDYESRTIVKYVGSNRTATLDSALNYGSPVGKKYTLQAQGFSSLGQHVCGEVNVGTTGSITLYPILRGAARHDPFNNGSYSREVLPYEVYTGEAVCAKLNFSRIDMSYANFYAREAAQVAAAAAQQAASDLAAVAAAVAAAGWGGTGSGGCCRVYDSDVLLALDLDVLDLCNCTNQSSRVPFLAYPNAVMLMLDGIALSERTSADDADWWDSLLHNKHGNVWDLVALLNDWDRDSYGRNATLCNHTIWNFSQYFAALEQPHLRPSHTCNISWNFSNASAQSPEATRQVFPGASSHSQLFRRSSDPASTRSSEFSTRSNRAHSSESRTLDDTPPSGAGVSLKDAVRGRMAVLASFTSSFAPASGAHSRTASDSSHSSTGTSKRVLNNKTPLACDEKRFVCACARVHVRVRVRVRVCIRVHVHVRVYWLHTHFTHAHIHTRNTPVRTRTHTCERPLS